MEINVCVCVCVCGKRISRSSQQIIKKSDLLTWPNDPLSVHLQADGL